MHESPIMNVECVPFFEQIKRYNNFISCLNIKSPLDFVIHQNSHFSLLNI